MVGTNPAGEINVGWSPNWSEGQVCTESLSQVESQTDVLGFEFILIYHGKRNLPH